MISSITVDIRPRETTESYLKRNLPRGARAALIDFDGSACSKTILDFLLERGLIRSTKKGFALTPMGRRVGDFFRDKSRRA